MDKLQRILNIALIIDLPIAFTLFLVDHNWWAATWVAITAVWFWIYTLYAKLVINQKETMDKQKMLIEEMMDYLDGTKSCEKVTRLEIISQAGREYVNMDVSNVEIDLQDKQATMKVFIETKKPQAMKRDNLLTYK